MRILLVEDDGMVGAAVAQALKDAAYAVDWVRDGQTAIEAARAETYDLTLLDLGLPVPDGTQVLREFRKMDRQLPVIIVTARDAIDDRIQGLDLGADDYIVKPFEIRELLALSSTRGTSCKTVRERAEKKMRDIQEKISALEAMNRALRKLADSCSGRGPLASCPILECLSGEKEMNCDVR